MDKLTAYAGRDTSWTVTILVDDGTGLLVPYTGFAGTEVLTLSISPGVGQAKVTLASSTATWLSAPAGTIMLSLAAADAALLTSINYDLLIDVTSGGKTFPVYHADLQVELTPGSATAVNSYCTMRDVYQVCPWIDTVIAGNDFLRPDLGEQRHRARHEIEHLIYSRARETFTWQYERHMPVLASDPIFPTTGVDAGPFWGESTIPNTSIRDQLNVYQGYLDSGFLLIDEHLIEACSKLTVAFALENAVGSGPDSTPYQKLAASYRNQANTQLGAWVAMIDTNGDGIAEIEIP